MALGFGEGTGGGLTNPSRSMAGGYGGIKATSSAAKANPRLTGDAHLYDYKNQNLATHKNLMEMYSSPKPSQQAGLGNDMMFPKSGSSGGGLGFSAQTENDMTNKATEEISVGQDEAKRSAQERAAALGFSRSGGTEEAMQRIDSAAAGDKANAARDTRIASANLGFQREQADLDRAERQAIRDSESQSADESALDAIRAQIEKSASARMGGGGGGGKRGGGGGKPAAQVIGGGAGNLTPLRGGGWGPAGGGGGGKPAGGNSTRSTF